MLKIKNILENSKPEAMLLEYFKNKSVALVACADYIELLDRENIRRIEECDIVIKMNKGFELSFTHSNSISSRVDFIYNSLLEDCVNGGVLDIDKIIKSPIQHIRTTPHSNMKGHATDGYYTNATKQETLDKTKKLQETWNLWTTIIDPVFFTNLSMLIDCKPTTGFAAIFDILSYKPSSLYVTGFSFFLGGPIKGYWGGSKPGGIEEKWGKTETQHAEKCFQSTRHIHRNMWKVFKDFYAESENIKLDPILEKIISLENYSKDGYNKIVSEYKNEKSKHSQ